MPGTAQDILNILVADRIIEQKDADTIAAEALASGESVEEIIRRKHLAKDADIIQARAKSLNIPYIILTGRAISPDVIQYIPEPVVRRYTLIPFNFDEATKELSVAMVDPLDFQVIEFLERKTGKKIHAFMAAKDDILSALENAFSQTLGDDVTKALQETETSAIKTYEAGHLGEVIREAPIAQIVSATLEQAMHLRASDINIEPLDGDTRIRYRIDGILQERLVLPKRLHDAVVSRIKILGDMKIDEKRIPQDGRFNFKMGSSEVDLRVSTLPTVHG